MKEYSIDYTDRKYSVDELQVKAEFNDIERGTQIDDITGETVGYIISSVPIQTVYFVLPITWTDEQINTRLQTYLDNLSV